MRLFRDMYRLRRLGLLWTPSLTPNRPASPSHGSPARLASGVFHVKLLAGPCGFSIDVLDFMDDDLWLLPSNTAACADAAASVLYG